MPTLLLLVLLLLALGSSTLVAGVARPLADALAQREAVRLPPSDRWMALTQATPRRSLIATWVVVVLIVVRWGAEPVAAVLTLVAAGAAMLASLVDLRCHRLPDLIVGPLGAGGLCVAGAWSVLAGDGRWLASALVAGATAGLVLGMGWLVGMGLGDVKFGAALGVLVGWAVGSPVGAVLAALAGVGLAALAGSGWWVWGAVVRGGAPRWFPFGPFLAASALVIGLLMGPPSGGSEAVGDSAGGPLVQAAGVASGEPVRPGGVGHR